MFRTRPKIVISSPMMVRHEFSPEVLDMITSGRLEDVSTSSRGRLTTISEESWSRSIPAAGQSHQEAANESGTTSSPSHSSLGSSFSSPEPPSNTFVLAQPWPLPKPPQPSHRYSIFSTGTEIVRGRCPWLRRVLDAGRCTKGDRFDIRDFSRVQPPIPRADLFVTPGGAGPMVMESLTEPVQPERWREGVRRVLYAGDRHTIRSGL